MNYQATPMKRWTSPFTCNRCFKVSLVMYFVCIATRSFNVDLYIYKVRSRYWFFCWIGTVALRSSTPTFLFKMKTSTHWAHLQSMNTLLAGSGIWTCLWPSKNKSSYRTHSTKTTWWSSRSSSSTTSSRSGTSSPRFPKRWWPHFRYC